MRLSGVWPTQQYALKCTVLTSLLGSLKLKQGISSILVKHYLQKELLYVILSNISVLSPLSMEELINSHRTVHMMRNVATEPFMIEIKPT